MNDLHSRCHRPLAPVDFSAVQLPLASVPRPRSVVGLLCGILLLLTLPARALEPASITFIAVSDTHYAIPDPKQGDVDMNVGKRKIVASMNALEGKKFPSALKGEKIGKPLGVLVAGDLINGGRDPDAKAQLKLWTRDFGLTGTDSEVLKLPVYETWGNHDGGKIVPGFIADRNRKRVGITPPTGGAGPSYSWDWGPLHLVSVGMYPGNANESTKHRSPGYDPHKSLEFLTDDLAKSVGDSKRPVLVMQHLNLPNDSDEWWTAAQRDAYLEVLKKYNVVAIVDGHEGGGLWQWNGIDVLGCNDINGGYWVVQIEGKRLIAARTRNGESWNERAVLNKTIETGKPAGKPAPPGLHSGK